MIFSKKIRTILAVSLLFLASATHCSFSRTDLYKVPQFLILNGLGVAIPSVLSFVSGEGLSKIPVALLGSNMLYLMSHYLGQSSVFEEEFKENLGDIITAAANKDHDKLKDAIKAGQDINMQSKDGYTALHWAVKNQDATSLILLLANGADFELPYKDKEYGKITPLMTACMNNDKMSIALLTWIGVNKNHRNSNNETALDILEKIKKTLRNQCNPLQNNDLLKSNYDMRQMLIDSKHVMNLFTNDALQIIEDIKRLWNSKQDASKHNTFYEKGKNRDLFDLNINYSYKPSNLL